MLGSLPVFDEVLEILLTWMAPTTALDIGTGSGKFAHMLRRAAPDCSLSGIEVEASYISASRCARFIRLSTRPTRRGGGATP